MDQWTTYLGGFEVIGRNSGNKLEAERFHVNPAVPFDSFAIKFWWTTSTSVWFFHLFNFTKASICYRVLEPLWFGWGWWYIWSEMKMIEKLRETRLYRDKGTGQGVVCMRVWAIQIIDSVAEKRWGALCAPHYKMTIKPMIIIDGYTETGPQKSDK